jgi:hypothetical protein
LKPETDQPRLPIPLEEVDDARLDGDHVELRLRSGKLVRLRLEPETLELYWAIKLRNRRRAFGL